MTQSASFPLDLDALRADIVSLMTGCSKWLLRGRQIMIFTRLIDSE